MIRNRGEYPHKPVFRDGIKMYDIIGDIHGHAGKLESLLARMGYSDRSGSYRHASRRKVVFLGDYVDRGPEIPRVLEIVRSMVDAGHALAIMGNHELNALCFHVEDKACPGRYLRPRSAKNQNQIRRTLEQLSGPGQLESWLAWFRSLPLWLDLDGIRAVHACWDDNSVKALDGALRGGGLTDSFLNQAIDNSGDDLRGLPLHLETVLKGKEARLPKGVSFTDREGHVRHEMRTRWYLDPDGHTYASYALQSDPLDCELPLGDEVLTTAAPYHADSKPVFVGHYWLWADRPEPLANNVACLDYSVAKDGFLCAYRWDGERRLSRDKFEWV